ncbi:hypothetical protein MSP8887_02795 [Marinomonas spartinae]|uniref:YhdP family protein n=1 Tax=Marinomonas spartinae TaxID=1792290 RepID=UPI0008091675|nr:YhdP family protein [Marinomonas spartinae]SBS37049.1 hypothetical protein MSP8887_02795 [Marinomonas spartinae]
MAKPLQRAISIIWWILVFIAAFLALVVVAAKLLLPLLNEYRPQIERNLSQISGYHISLGKIGGGLEGIDPTIYASNVNLDIDGQSAVSVSEVRIRLNTIKSLLTFSPQFTYLRFTKPSVALQERQGKWLLKGAKASHDVQNDVGIERILGYLMAQKRFSMLDAKIILDSDQLGAHELLIPKAYVFQSDLSSWIKVNAYLDGKSDPFTINAKVSQLLGVIGDYHVQANINVPNIKLSLADSAFSWAKPFKSVQFGGKFWLNYRVGHSIDLQGQSTTFAVALKNGQAYQTHPNFKLRFSQRFPSLSLSVNDLSIEDETGHIADTTNLVYDWSGASDRSFVKFDQIDLGIVNRIATNFLQPKWHIASLLKGLNPKGVASNGSLLLDLHSKDPSYHYLSNFQDASIDGFNGIPKATHLNGTFNLTDEGGVVQFKGKNGYLEFPTVYDNGWNVNQMSGQVTWRENQGTFIVSGKNLYLVRHNAQVVGGFRLESRPNESDWLSLSLGIDHVPVKDRNDYIPKGVLDPSTLNWLNQAFKSGKGTINNMSLVVQAGLRKGDDADVRMKMNVKGADVDFAKGWPVAKQVDGDVDLDKSGLHVAVKSGSLSGLTVKNVFIDLPIEKNKVDWVNVHGALDQDSASVLAMLRTTPLKDSVLSAFDQWRISGPVKGDFSVDIPLTNKNPDPKIGLNLRFQNNPLYIGDADLNTRVKQGQLHFDSSKGFYNTRFDVQALSGDTTISLSSKNKADGGMVIQADMTGTAQVEDIAKWQKAPQLLLPHLSGEMTYSALLSVNQSQAGQVDLTVNSNLLGVRIDLPKPFNKQANVSEPLSLKIMSHQHDLVLQGQYGEKIRSKLLFKSAKFVGGQVLVNSKKPLDQTLYKGLSVDGQMKKVDVDTWKKALFSPDVSSFSANDSKPGGGKNLADLSTSLVVPKWLRQVNFIIDQVVVNPQNTFHNMKITYGDGDKALKVASDEVNFMFDTYKNKPRLRIGYLNWTTAPSAADKKGVGDKKDQVVSQKSAISEPPIHANEIPSMYLSINKLFINQRPYGDWNLTIESDGNELRIDPLSSALKKGSFDGRLLWVDDGSRSKVELAMAIKGKDLAELTKKFAKTAFVTSKKYDINVSLVWKGNPFEFDRKTLSGRISFSAFDGNASKVDDMPVFLKVFGIFNVESLTRRLSLDFSDLFQPGLTYDSTKGDFVVKNGIIKTTTPLSIISPSADLSIEGKADIVNETLDEVLTATLPISGTLPLAGLIWATPQIAGLLYLTDKLIGDQISKVTSVQYKVQGSFSNPTLTPIVHKLKKRSNR